MTEEEAERIGRMANANGIPKDENPFQLEPLLSAWDRGWEANLAARSSTISQSNLPFNG